MFNVLVTGSNGQLGSELKDLASDYSKYNFYFTDVKELDITNQKSVKIFIKEKDIKIIINCAAYTAVDKAESEFEINNQINHLAVKNFSEIAKTNNIQLIQVSTDYVFDGANNQPYIESDKTNPQSVYGKTKLSGEEAMLNINPENSIIIRTSWVYSSYGNNFLKTMLQLGNERDELGVIFDQVGTPTYAKDLANTILKVLPKIKSDNVEVYHFSNQGVCSWYDFAKAIFEITSLKIKINPIDTSQYPTEAKRPFYSIMNKAKIIAKYKIEIPHWRESLSECINVLEKNNNK